MNGGLPLGLEKKALYKDFPGVPTLGLAPMMAMAAGVPTEGSRVCGLALTHSRIASLALSRAAASPGSGNDAKLDPPSGLERAYGAERCRRFFLCEEAGIRRLMLFGLLPVERPELSGVVRNAGDSGEGGTGECGSCTGSEGRELVLAREGSCGLGYPASEGTSGGRRSVAVC